MKQIKKRDGSFVEFDASKIRIAIQNANEDVPEKEKAGKHIIEQIVQSISIAAADRELSVEEIQDLVEESLMKNKLFKLAKVYIVFRYERALIRKANATDDNILQLVRGKNDFLNKENSNKNSYIASTQRDLMAGEVSKDISRRLLLPEDVVRAHDRGAIHFHDMDYFLQGIFNCCLIAIGDMLDNGTVINGKLIESPKSFRVACTVMTQIIASVASNQYGGQSVRIAHLARYLKLSEEKYRRMTDAVLNNKVSESDLPQKDFDYLRESIRYADRVSPEMKKAVSEALTGILLKKELKDGVQTIQYQINTLMTTNGQAPFVTLFLDLDKNDEYLEYTAMIIQEILEQRIQGVKNEKGAWITPAFPKLVYVLDENNCLRGGRYDYLTKIAVKCSAKRMYPDYISAKGMRRNYQGNVFSPMGCRSFLSPWKDQDGNYKFEGRFNQGVVSLNLPQIAILAKGKESAFWKILENRLAIAFKALMCRHEALEGTVSDISPLHFQHGAIARLDKGEPIDSLLHNGYSTLSLGYIGVYEMTKLITGESHTAGKGKRFALSVMQRLRDACDSWKKATGIGFALYGTPAESLCYRFASLDLKRFGSIEDVTDKGYYTNSYHVDVREKIDAFSKLMFESEFQVISSGGAISYVEIPYMMKNLDALEDLIKFIYDNIQYAEFNTKSDNCHVCGFSGEIVLNADNQWECPQCHNTDKERMSVTRRTCGYLGENFWNEGKTKEIGDRVLHL